MACKTVQLLNRPCIAAWSSTAGRKENEGPLGGHFDFVLDDDLLGQKSWELAEASMMHRTIISCLNKAHVECDSIDALLCGDLINQNMASNMCARQLDIPLIGLYNACSTMSESLAVGAMLLNGNVINRVVCAVSSHFSTAERQYRAPLEQGGQRPASAQWTVTGSGATLLCTKDHIPDNVHPAASISHVTLGRVVDYGVSDMANMGAAMAPAAADTLFRHLTDTGRQADYYDEIITGDLGIIGRRLFIELMKEKGFTLDPARVWDCGACMFSREQDAHAGGSGCGCSAITLNGYILERFQSGNLKCAIFMATGALLNATSVLQGESIPGISHLVVLERY